MSTKLLEQINLGEIAEEIRAYENQWIVISGANQIVGSGDTYEKALKSAGKSEDIVLFKVPPLGASLAL